MRFWSEQRNPRHSIFSVSVTDVEIDSYVHSTSLYNRFQISCLDRLARMIAAYYFKKHKDRIDEILSDTKLEEAIHRAIIEKVKDKIKIT